MCKLAFWVEVCRLLAPRTAMRAGIRRGLAVRTMVPKMLQNPPKGGFCLGFGCFPDTGREVPPAAGDAVCRMQADAHPVRGIRCSGARGPADMRRRPARKAGLPPGLENVPVTKGARNTAKVICPTVQVSGAKKRIPDPGQEEVGRRPVRDLPQADRPARAADRLPVVRSHARLRIAPLVLRSHARLRIAVHRRRGRPRSTPPPPSAPRPAFWRPARRLCRLFSRPAAPRPAFWRPARAVPCPRGRCGPAPDPQSLPACPACDVHGRSAVGPAQAGGSPRAGNGAASDRPTSDRLQEDTCLPEGTPWCRAPRPGTQDAAVRPAGLCGGPDSRHTRIQIRGVSGGIAAQTGRFQE